MGSEMCIRDSNRGECIMQPVHLRQGPVANRQCTAQVRYKHSLGAELMVQHQEPMLPGGVLKVNRGSEHPVDCPVQRRDGRM